jgi:hypothetical protein
MMDIIKYAISQTNAPKMIGSRFAQQKFTKYLLLGESKRPKRQPTMALRNIPWQIFPTVSLSI